MTEHASPQLDSATEWFLSRGVPAVLRPRERWSALLSRSAPGLAAYCALMVVSLVIAVLSGGRDINIDNDPTATEWLIIVLLTVTVPVMALAAWAVSWIDSRGPRRVVALISIVGGVAADLYQDGPLDILADSITDLVFVAAILAATASGLGSVLAWALRTTLSHLASAGRLAARALPVVLLTVLVFFNAAVWSMAANLTTDRFWILVTFMAAVAVSFLTVSMRDRVRLLGKGIDRAPDAVPLSRAEWANLLFVAVASQVIQIITVALVTMAIFFVLGLIVLSPPVLARWTAGDTAQATLFDITLPLPLALVHVTLFLGALTFMYVSARAVSDPEHRSDYLDPLFEDLHATVVARDAYRSAVAD